MHNRGMNEARIGLITLTRLDLNRGKIGAKIYRY